MSRCNVDFFDPQLNYICHDTIETPGIDLDYLTPESSTFEIGQTNAIPVKSFVRIEGHNNCVCVVDNVNQGNGFTKISIKPFPMIFDQAVMFDTKWQYHAPIPAGTNLIKFDFEGQTVNGVTFVMDKDNKFTVNGVATDDVVVKIGTFKASSGKSLKITGCPEDGDLSTYYMSIDTGDTTTWTDIGTGVSGGDPVSATGDKMTVRIRVMAGTVVDNLVFIPRVVDANEKIKDDPNEGLNDDAKPLETLIGDLITQYWIESDDNPQNIPLHISTISQTTNWSFGLVGDKAEDKQAIEDKLDHYCIVEFYDTILQNALMRYRVALESEFDLENKRINVTIGVANTAKIIETSLPDVEVVEFTIGQLSADVNKLEIWNEENYDQESVIYYYLHKDGKYNQDKGSDRITPIKMEVLSTKTEYEYERIENPSGNPKNKGWYEYVDGYYKLSKRTSVSDKDYYERKTVKPFDVAAKEQADQKFGDIQWKNYIELDVSTDNIFNASSMRIGQLVNIIHKGETYETILTGKTLSDYTTLIFGTIRVDLTKKTQLNASVEYTTAKSVTKNSSTSSR